MFRTILRLLLVSVSAPLWAQEPPAPVALTPVTSARAVLPPSTETYPLATCVVSGEPFEDDAVVFSVGDREVRTCCAKCQAKVEKEPKPFLAKLDAAIVARQTPRYPLTNCVVSGKPLGSMGEPIAHVFDGVLVQLCCKGCNKKALAAASEMRTKVLQAHYERDSANYALEVCPISGEPLGDDVVERMLDTRLVRFCCNNCAAKLSRKASAVAAQLDAAERARSEEVAADPAEATTETPTKKPAKEPAKKPKKDDGTAATSGKAQGAANGGSCCGDACVEGATGGCCQNGGKPTAKPAGGVTLPKVEAKGATECCESGSSSTPANPPKKIH